jgi:hypothetical protein
MVLTAYFVLSPVIGLSCHRHLALLLARLDASVGASGPHAFAVRVSAIRQSAPPASTASRPALMTCATPLEWDRTAEDIDRFASSENQNIFAKGAGQGDEQTVQLICPSGKSVP